MSDKDASVSVNIIPWSAMRFRCLILFLFGIASAQAQQPALNTAKRHVSRGLSCAVCHPSGTGQPATEKACIGCHGSYSVLGEKTASTFTENPHNGHLGKLPCTTCHHGHKPLTAYCQGCHADMTIERAVPRPVPLKSSIACTTCHPLKGRQFSASAHGTSGNFKNEQPCLGCHAEHSLQPMAKRNDVELHKLGTTACRGCHEKAGTNATMVALASDLHQGPRSPGCAECHGSHDIGSMTKQPVRAMQMTVLATCRGCHADVQRPHQQVQVKSNALDDCSGCHVSHPSKVAKGAAIKTCQSCHASLPASRQGSASRVMDDLRQSVHAKLTCSQCHTRIEENHSLTGKNLDATVDCVRCHQRQGREYTMSAHGQQRYTGLRVFVSFDAEAQRPRCIDCHGTHGIRNHADPASPVARTNSISLCVRCHSAAAATTYFSSYHGKAAQLGSVKTAQCIDCHGAHAILPQSDPRALTASVNLTATCGRCHAGSSAGFVQYIAHADQNNRVRSRDLFLASRAMKILMRTTLILFLAHVLLWLPRSFRERRHLKVADGRQSLQGNLNSLAEDNDCTQGSTNE